MRLAAVLLLAVLAAPPTSTPTAAAPDLRLPDAVRPVREALDLELDPAQERYRGSARIEVELREPAATIWLHAYGLAIESARIVSAGGAQPARTVAGAPGFLGLALERPVAAGRATIEIEFSGAFDRVRSRGLYAAKEGNAWFAYTFFEPIDARRAFPCFDEPRFKIPWRVAVRVPRGQGAYANPPAESSSIDGKWTRVAFAESRPMPSYLVALAAGPFEVVDAGTVGGPAVPLRFLVPPGRGPETRQAAGTLPRIVSALEEWTGIPFPYEKLDVLAVPRSGGTMEHPGLLALGQPFLLLRSEDATPERRRAAASLAAHELSHYWFGDLVTPAWWDDTWLNEAFASWMDAQITDSLDPAWSALSARRAEDRGMAMAADALPSAKRLREPVRSRHEIEGSFDAELTYAKGASVLAMVAAWLGPDKWRAVVRRHLAAHAWGVVTSEDLYAAAEAEAGPEAAAVLRSFAEQPGFPRISVEARCGRRSARLLLSQAPVGPGGPRTWTVPVCVRWGVGSRERRACAVLSAEKGELALPACPRWVVPDAGGEGYGLARLGARELSALLPHMTPAEERAAVADAVLAVRLGYLPVADALALAPALARDRLNAEAALELARLANPRELDDQVRSRWRRFVLTTFGARARALGLLPRPGEGEEDAALRDELVPFAAVEGEEAGLAGEAAALARRWLSDRRTIPAEVAGRALAIAARFGNRALFDRTLEVARTAEERRDRAIALDALGLFRDPALVREALGLGPGPALDQDDTLRVLEEALGSREGREPAWELLRDRFAALAEKMRSDEVNDLLSAVGKAFCDLERRRQVAEALETKVQAIDGAPLALARALDEIDACAASRRRDAAGISRFLARY